MASISPLRNQSFREVEMGHWAWDQRYFTRLWDSEKVKINSSKICSLLSCLTGLIDVKDGTPVSLKKKMMALALHAQKKKLCKDGT